MLLIEFHSIRVFQGQSVLINLLQCHRCIFSCNTADAFHPITVQLHKYISLSFLQPRFSAVPPTEAAPLLFSVPARDQDVVVSASGLFFPFYTFSPNRDWRGRMKMDRGIDSLRTKLSAIVIFPHSVRFTGDQVRNCLEKKQGSGCCG